MAAGGGPIQVRPAACTARANVGVLRQEAVSGVHGVGPGGAGRVDDQVGAQVGVGGGGAGQPYRRVGLGTCGASASGSE